MEIVLEQFTNFMNTLDWVYIFSFILITYVVQFYKVPELLGNALELRLPKKYQVVLIGLVYAIIVFFARGYDLTKIFCLSISFCFATVFHKFLLEVLVDRFLPNSQEYDLEELE